MEFWRSLLDQSDQDMLDSKTLLEHCSYGSAAYHAQQCLEKAIKAYLIKHGLYQQDPETLGHLPLIKLIDIFLRYMSRTKKPTHKIKNIHLARLAKVVEEGTSLKQQRLKEFKLVLNSIKRNENNLKYDLWKLSLGLEVNNRLVSEIISRSERYEKKEKNYIQSSYENIRKVAQSVFTTYEQKTKFKDSLLQLGAPTYVADYYAGESFISTNDVYNKIETEDNSHFSSEYTLELLLKEIKEHSPETMAIHESEKMRQIAYIFNHADIITRIFPHEEIGRYPTMIDGKDSRLIYEERKEELRNLVDKTLEAQGEIREKLSI